MLLVENSRTGRAILLQQLQAQGYEADAVGSGKEAIQAITDNDYSLVIMDIFLPEMNGYEAAQHIRQLGSAKSQIPIIGLSSSTEETDKSRSLEAGMNAYVIKSDDNNALFTHIKQLQG